MIAFRMRRALPALLLFGALLTAQEPAARPPRIGLVLSGGGARGTAHVGVLQVLEELRIPVYCIAGTSMGAIVGGLYSYGMSPAQLRQLVTREGLTRGWDVLLRDGGTFQDLPFRRKEEYHTYLTKARLGIRDGGVHLPKGVVQGQNLETELRLLTLEAHDLNSFDELPIRFRCTGVDLMTGDEVVLGRGNLAEALRASMSLPGIFAPAVIDGRELLDGGLANNVPIDVARAMGAEVLIVVDIGTPVDKESQVKDLVGVTQKMIAILTQQNVDRSLRTRQAADVLIQPDLEDITSADFARASEAVAIGRAAQRRKPRPPPVLRSVEVHNDSGLSDGVLERRLELEPGKPLHEEDLRPNLERLFAIGDFQRVRFQVQNWHNDEADVAIATETKGWGASFLGFGLSLRSDLDRTSYQLAGLLVLRQMDGLGAEWRNVLEVGQRRTLYSEFYQPLLQSGLLFVAPHGGIGSDQYDFYQDRKLVSEEKVQYGAAGIDVGLELGTPGELRLGYQWLTGDSEVILANQPVPDRSFEDGYFRALLRFDRLDDSHFAHSGWYGALEYRLAREDLGADADYQTLRGRGGVAVSFGSFTVIPALQFDTALDGTRPFYSEPTLGGFRQLSGLPNDSLRGQHTALAVLEARKHLADGICSLYVGGTFEAGDVWDTRSARLRNPVPAGSLYLAADLPLGPLYIGVGVAEGGEVTGFLYLGPDLF
jgi:NTE family protein